MAKLLVVIPTYNEIENIEAISKAIMRMPEADLLVVDDASPDGTSAKVRELQLHWPSRIHLLERAGKLGLGTAYLAGFAWGLDRNYQYICEMDADFSHDPADVPRLLQTCEEGADVAIGSRYVKGGKVRNWPRNRIMISYCASLYVRSVTWMPVHDATAGFVCYRAEALREMMRYPIKMKGYGFQVEMKFLAYRLGFTIKELPIVFTDRTLGQSKMSGGIFSEALFGVLKMRCARLRKLQDERIQETGKA